MESEIYEKPGWKARGDFCAPESKKRRPFFPRIRHLIKSIGLIVRYVFCHWQHHMFWMEHYCHWHDICGSKPFNLAACTAVFSLRFLGSPPQAERSGEVMCSNNTENTFADFFITGLFPGGMAVGISSIFFGWLGIIRSLVSGFHFPALIEHCLFL